MSLLTERCNVKRLARKARQKSRLKSLDVKTGNICRRLPPLYMRRTTGPVFEGLALGGKHDTQVRHLASAIMLTDAGA